MTQDTQQESLLKIILTPDPNGDYVTIADYIRKRHIQDLKKDATAPMLYNASIRRVIDRGEIEVLQQGVHFYIDWNKYKNYVFRRFIQRK